MSLEAKIEALTAAIGTLIGVMQNTTVSVPVVTAPAPAPVMPAAPMPAVPAPVAAIEVPVAPPAPAAAPAVQMPAPPSFLPQPPAAPAAPAAAPFTDAQGLTAYVVAAYQSLGEKGMQIQTILTNLGHTNVNEVPPEKYSALYAAVEALKAA